tara:strand:+ start:164 stop:364 length:201 start_codon:yes stop_codon:yes gene_type:complete
MYHIQKSNRGWPTKRVRLFADTYLELKEGKEVLKNHPDFPWLFFDHVTQKFKDNQWSIEALYQRSW